MGRVRKDIRAWQEAFRQWRSVDWAERRAGRQRSRGSPRLGGASPFPVDLVGDTDYLRPPFRKGTTGGVEGGGLHWFTLLAVRFRRVLQSRDREARGSLPPLHLHG